MRKSPDLDFTCNESLVLVCAGGVYNLLHCVYYKKRIKEAGTKAVWSKHLKKVYKVFEMQVFIQTKLIYLTILLRIWIYEIPPLCKKKNHSDFISHINISSLENIWMFFLGWRNQNNWCSQSREVLTSRTSKSQ